MQAAKQRDTAPEVKLRKALYEIGVRGYRVNRRPSKSSTGTADLVFIRKKIAIFVDGCYWHSCPIHGTSPKSNSKWWSAKLSANRDRDERINKALLEEGWSVLRIWEHQNSEQGARVIYDLLNGSWFCEETINEYRLFEPSHAGCERV